MASEPTAPRDVRPVVAALSLVASIALAETQPRAATAPTNEQVEGAPKRGVAVFPPPGTDAPKAGIIVPDGYQLPPGYVRHYQTTDDGKQLPPILMFHPDFHPVDDRGQPIALPADRVVPPEMAPPGLPHDMLDVSPTRAPVARDPQR